MILTQCPICAAELPPLSAKQCSRCKTRYCGPACQKKHWEEGGHDKLCRKIRKSGGAELYNASTQYAAAVAVAAEKCADDTKGQTCYICTQALHWKTKEGLVRGCSCRGTAGFAHVSCLAEQAKILFAEAEENNLGDKAINERFQRWYTCSLCEQEYHGAVRCALGWACWKTYVGRRETDQVRYLAMTELGIGLSEAEHHEDALTVQEAHLSTMRRLGVSQDNILAAQSNLANTYRMLGRFEEAVRMQRVAYYGLVRLYGEEHACALSEAGNYAGILLTQGRFDEAKSLSRKTVPVMRRVLGDSHELTLKIRWLYALALCRDPTATLDDLRESVTTLGDVERTARRVFGGAHPLVLQIEEALREAQAALHARASRDEA